MRPAKAELLLFVWVLSYVFLLFWAVAPVSAPTDNTTPSAIGPLDNTGDALADVQADDQTGNSPSAVTQGDGWYTVDKEYTMFIDNFDTSALSGNVTAAVLWVQYSVESGYTGTMPVRWALDGQSLASTGIVPADGQVDQIGTYDLYAQGVDTLAEVSTLDIEFTNNDGASPNAVSFDYVWVEVTTIVNQPPEAPTLSSPPNGSTTSDNTPTFKWQTSTDPEGDDVTYWIQVDNDSNFLTPAENENGLTDNFYTPTAELPDGDYYWRVRAVDNNNNEGDWSTWTLTVLAFDFSVSASPNSLSVEQGSDNTTTITVTLEGGTTQNVTLSGSWIGGTPSGISTNFDPPSGNPTYSSTLTFTADAGASQGNFTYRVTGTGGGLNRYTDIALTVEPGFDFSVSASPDAVTVLPGSDNTTSITITLVSGTTQNVTLSGSWIGGTPSGISTNFDPPSGNPTYSSTLTFTADAGASQGNFTYRVTGTGGGLNRYTDIALTVEPGFDFSVSASPGAVTVLPGSDNTTSITVTLVSGPTENVTLSGSWIGGTPSGISTNFDPPSGNPTYSSTLTFTADAGASQGSFTYRVTGTGGGLSRYTDIALGVGVPPFNFSVDASPHSLTVDQGENTASTISVTLVSGTAENVSLSGAWVGVTPSGVTAEFNPALGSPTYESILSFAISGDASTGTFTYRVTGANGGLTRTGDITLTINQAPTFNYQVTASPDDLLLVRGSTATSTITVEYLTGSPRSVSLDGSWVGENPGIETSFDPVSGTPSLNTPFRSILTFTVPFTASGGTFRFRVRGTSENTAREDDITVRLVPLPPSLESPENGRALDTLKPEFRWKEASGATSYTIVVATDDDFEYEVFTGEPDGLTYTSPEPLSRDTRYYWKVSATNEAGTGDWSETWTFIVKETIARIVSYEIAGGALYTTSRPVTITLDAPYADEVSFSTDGVEWSEWQPYEATVQFTLPENDGLVTVYVKARDVDGDTGPISLRSITLDRAPPHTTYSCSGVLDNRGYRDFVTITLDADDNTSGVKTTWYRIDNGEWKTGTSFVISDAGTHTIEYYSEDMAGNVEGITRFGVKVYTPVEPPVEPPVTQIEPTPPIISPILAQYWWAVLAAVVGAGVSSAFLVRRVKLVSRLERVRRERRGVARLMREAEIKYYREGSITRDTFEELMRGYEKRAAELEGEERILKAKVKRKRIKRKKVKPKKIRRRARKRGPRKKGRRKR